MINKNGSREMGKRTNKIVLIVLSMVVLLCGFIFDNPEMTLDTEENIVYQNLSIDKLLADFAADDDLAEETYAKARIVLWGKVSEISKNAKDVTLISLNGNQEGSIKCSSSNKDIIAYVKTLSQGDIVKVYGKFSISLVGKDMCMDTTKIEKTADQLRSNTCYSMLNGNTVDREDMYIRTLADEKITYYIPTEWSGMEYDLVENKLGRIEGYQYRLNEMPQSATVQPESLFICYFDNKLLKNSSDKSKTDQIERAIIANILNKDADSLDKFPTEKVTTYYGTKYQYYQDAYKDILGQGHHVEFVFQKVDTDGIIVYLYIYTDANHVNDIMYLMRLLDVK